MIMIHKNNFTKTSIIDVILDLVFIILELYLQIKILIITNY